MGGKTEKHTDKETELNSKRKAIQDKHRMQHRQGMTVKM